MNKIEKNVPLTSNHHLDMLLAMDVGDSFHVDFLTEQEMKRWRASIHHLVRVTRERGTKIAVATRKTSNLSVRIWRVATKKN